MKDAHSKAFVSFVLFLLGEDPLVESNISLQTQVILTHNKDGLCPISRFWVGAGRPVPPGIRVSLKGSGTQLCEDGVGERVGLLLEH